MRQKPSRCGGRPSAKPAYRSGIATLACVTLTTWAAPATVPGWALFAQDAASGQGVPVIDVTGPTVIAFWTVPASNAALEANELLAMALDDQQYFWAETRDRLAAMDVRPIGQPGRAFTLRDATGERSFSASPDSADVGYVLVAPGEPIQVLYRLHYPDQLIAEARTYFDETAAPPGAQTPVARWLPLYQDGGIVRLENENRISELCSNADPVEVDACYSRVLAPAVDFYPLHVAPDSTSDRVGELIVTTVPGRGLFASFRPARSNETVSFTPDLYLQDWFYGPYFHQTVVARRGAWFQLPRRPWPDPVWVHRPEQLESSSLRRVRVGDILDMRGEGWVVVQIMPDALMMRPEQEADMWCEPVDPPPLMPTEPTRFTQGQLVDEDGHLVIRPKYMKGC